MRRRHDSHFSSPAVERARERAAERERARHQGDTGRRRGDTVDLTVPAHELDDGVVEIHEDLPRNVVKTIVEDGGEVSWSDDGDGRIDVVVEREAAFVKLTGSARLRLMHPCVRCGQRDVPFDITVPLSLRLVERSGKDTPEADYQHFDDGDDHAGSPLGSAADLEDIDIASYVDGTIDLAAVMREQLFLEVETHPNCTSSGACFTGVCGLEEQQQTLDSERERFVDPRWAGLAALRDQLATSAASSEAPPKKTAPKKTAPKKATKKK